MTREEMAAQTESTVPKPKSKEIGGKHTVGGYLSKVMGRGGTNYPGFQVPAEQEQAAKAVVEEALKPRKQMYEPWKSNSAPEFYDGISPVKQDH